MVEGRLEKGQKVVVVEDLVSTGGSSLKAVDAIRESGGSGVAVGEGEIVSAFRELGKHGIPAGYESAALLAAFLKLRNTAEVPLGSRVLFLLTSNHLIALGQGSLPAGD